MGETVKRWRQVGAALVVVVCVLAIFGGDCCSEASAAWISIDGGGATGLNTGTTNPQKPVVVSHNNALYAAWIEADTSSVIIKKYDGSSWSDAGASGAVLVSSVNSAQPALASYNGGLYVAYVTTDSCWGNARIRIKKFNGTSWSDANNNNYNISTSTNLTCSGGGPSNPYPGANINHIFNVEATSPSLLAVNGKLYVAWMEWPNGIGHYNIRVAALDTTISPDWQIIDGGGNTGLNFDSTKDAGQAVSPLMAWYNNRLYVGWVESNVRAELRVKEYNPATGTWVFVDGGAATGLNYVPPLPIDPINRDALNPHLVTYNNALYAIWSENTYNDPDWGPMAQLRYKKYDGTGWSTDGSGVDGGSPLNYAKANPAYEPTAVVYNNLLKLAWSETKLADPWPIEIRVASFDGTTRSFVDSSDDSGINVNTALNADQPKLAELNGYLYAIWREYNAATVPQIRAKKLSLPPYVTSVAVPANATYKSGDLLDFMVTFNKVVTVTAALYLPITLDTGGTVNAAYVSGSGTKTLFFRYAITNGVADGNGITVSAAFNATGGTLRDADANNADLTLNFIAPTTAVLVDGIAPTAAISYVPSGPYKAGDVVVITATFSEAMAAAPAPQIAFSGAITQLATEMTRTDATHYSSVHTVGLGSGTVTVALSVGIDLAGNLVSSAPSGGATFVVIPPPTVSTAAATGITASGATLNGTVNANGDSTTVMFDYGTSTSYSNTGIVAIPNPVTGSTTTPISVTLSGLSCRTLYHFRAYGVNIGGSTNGSDLIFTTAKCNQAIGGISFSPNPLPVNGTSEVSASSTSGLPVSFSSQTLGVCTVSGTTVTGITAGTCIVAADQAGDDTYNAALRTTQDITVTNQFHTLTVTVTGQGSVTSSPQNNNAIACTDTGSGCSSTFPHGTPVLLSAFPTSLSMFARWDGACSGTTSVCNLTLNDDLTVGAAFIYLAPLMIQGTPASYHDTLISALEAMVDNSRVTLFGRAVTLVAGFTLSRPVSLTIKGGYDNGFATQQDVTVIQGKLTVNNGTLRVENVNVR